MIAIDALMGCSPELISLISETSDLADASQPLQDVSRSLGGEDNSLKERLQDVQARRNNIERRLYTLSQLLPLPSPGSLFVDEDRQSATEELGYIAETRRLSALVYLYSRLDNVPPGCSPIDRLTGQILALIPKISLRSHALLWPLFVVGTMGIGGASQDGGDADRVFVLERLVSLQRTRRLRNVSRAKHIVEAVWRIRDLRGPESLGGWGDIAGVESYGVSLC